MVQTLFGAVDSVSKRCVSNRSVTVAGDMNRVSWLWFVRPLLLLEMSAQNGSGAEAIEFLQKMKCTNALGNLDAVPC